MSQPYQALYRSWRPQRFDAVVGQEHVIRTLGNALRTGRVAHAYLFAGPRGTGKTSVAKLLAKAVNCASPDGIEPCNRCDLCREINDGSTMDVLEIDAASNRGIDEIRELRERVRYAPARGRYKVYIIDEVHMLTTEAFNALLKTLEEPPAHALFILATTEPHRLPATIVSRCQRFDFHRLAPEQIVQRLEAVCTAMGVQADPEALRLLARLADGGLRDALSLLDQCLAMAGERLDAQVVVDLLGLAPGEGILALTRAVVEGDVGAGLRAVADLSAQGVDLAQTLRDWVACWRDLLALRSGLGSHHLLYAGEELAAQLQPLARALDEASALACFDALAEGESLLRWSGQPRLALEAALIRAVGERRMRAGGTVAARGAEAAGTAGGPEPAAAPAPAAPPGPAGSPTGPVGSGLVARPEGRGGRQSPSAAVPGGQPGSDPAAGVTGTPASSDSEPAGPAPEAAGVPVPSGSAGAPTAAGAAGGPTPAGIAGPPAPAGAGGPAPAAALVQQWERFLQALRRRREWTALHALLRAAGAPRAVGDEVEIPFAQPGMARTAEVKLPQLRRAIEAFLGSPVPVRIAVDGGHGGPPAPPPGPGPAASLHGGAPGGARAPATPPAAPARGPAAEVAGETAAAGDVGLAPRPLEADPGDGDPPAPGRGSLLPEARSGEPGGPGGPGGPGTVGGPAPERPPGQAPGRAGAAVGGHGSPPARATAGRGQRPVRPADEPAAGDPDGDAPAGDPQAPDPPGSPGPDGAGRGPGGAPAPGAPVAGARPAAGMAAAPAAGPTVPGGPAVGEGGPDSSTPGAPLDPLDPGAAGEAPPPGLDAVQKAAWELFGGQWIPVKEEWQRELRPHGQDAETA